tara:strand:- start:1133 stop:1405 length:273 start_codon:yes stop_codon:yes gene_type:complete
MKLAPQQDISLLNVNLSNARSENESYDDYRMRLKNNKAILKTYFQYGREGFRTMFPNGVADAMKAPAPEQPMQTTADATDSGIEYRLNRE